MSKMLMRAYGRVQHAIYKRKVEHHSARGLSPRRARRAQRRREKRGLEGG